jgi:hypothetical protein
VKDRRAMEELRKTAPSREAVDEESRRIRRLRLAVNLALSVIAQGDLSYEEASDLYQATRRAALAMFPGKEATFDLLYRPKFQRLMRDVYRLQ